MYKILFLTCLLVGCRPGEARWARRPEIKVWQEFNAPPAAAMWKGRWSKPTTKTKLPHVIPIPSVLAQDFHEYLGQLAPDCEWIFPGDQRHPRRKHPGPVCESTIQKYWGQVIDLAGLPDLQIRDLRRTGPTWMVGAGVSLGLVSKGILNHTSFQTTSVYVQPMLDPVEQALDAYAGKVLGYATSR